MSKDQSKTKQLISYFIFGLVFTVMAYILALWAIDSGILLAYGLAILAVLYAVKFYFFLIKLAFFKNDKAKPSRRTSKKTTKG